MKLDGILERKFLSENGHRAAPTMVPFLQQFQSARSVADPIRALMSAALR
jgi:hypothetical protein